MTTLNEMVNVRYMVDDVEDAVVFYTTYLGFEVISNTAPAFADVKRGNLRLLLAGPTSSAGRPIPDGAKPGPGGWNRIHFHVDDIAAEVARLRDAGAQFRNDIVEGPGGKQILLLDPSGNVVELFQPAASNVRADIRSEPAVTAPPTLDHIALTVPNLDEQVDRLDGAFGMVVQMRSEFFAVIVDARSGFKVELSRSDDGEVHLRHLGFRADDVDAAHASLVAAGMETAQAPHRQDFANIYTSYLQQPGGVEVQLVKYD